METAPDGTAEVKLPPGSYEITLSAPGFLPATQAITITEDQVGQVVHLDFFLDPATATLRVVALTGPPASRRPVAGATVAVVASS